jgi:hypothetical protein
VRRALVVIGTAAVLLAAPATASADVIFDNADGEDLAATLAEAYEAQGVCYGWHVDVDNVGTFESSSGSNFGFGTRLRDTPEFSSCDTTVEFQANIQWTSESSESEDSASYNLESLPQGPTTSDLNSLEIISEDGLEGDNVDIDVYKAVAALPLLAADAGVADPLEASPAPETAAEEAGGQPTNSPGSDFLRQSGGAILFGALLVLGGGVFAFWSLRSSSARRRAAAAPVEPGGETPEYVPPEWYDPKTAPPNVRPAPTTPPPPTPPASPARPDPADTPEPGARQQPETPPGGPAAKPADPPDSQTRPEE